MSETHSNVCLALEFCRRKRVNMRKFCEQLYLPCFAIHISCFSMYVSECKYKCMSSAYLQVSDLSEQKVLSKRKCFLYRIFLNKQFRYRIFLNKKHCFFSKLHDLSEKFGKIRQFTFLISCTSSHSGMHFYWFCLQKRRMLAKTVIKIACHTFCKQEATQRNAGSCNHTEQSANCGGNFTFKAIQSFVKRR